MTTKSLNKRYDIIALFLAVSLVIGLAVYGLFSDFLMLIGLTALGIVFVDIPLILLISAIVSKKKAASAKAQKPVSGAGIPETAN